MAARRSWALLQVATGPLTTLIVATLLLIHQQQAFEFHRRAEMECHREMLEEIKSLRIENDRLWESHRYLTRSIQAMNQDIRTLKGVK